MKRGRRFAAAITALGGRWIFSARNGGRINPVLAYVETEGISDDFDLSTGIGLMLVGNPLKIIRQKSFQDFIVTGVMSSVPLFLSLPGPRGHQAATVSLNTEQMVEAIGRGAVKDGLEAALKLLRGWDFQRAVITYSGNDVSSPEE